MRIFHICLFLQALFQNLTRILLLILCSQCNLESTKGVCRGFDLGWIALRNKITSEMTFKKLRKVRN